MTTKYEQAIAKLTLETLKERVNDLLKECPTAHYLEFEAEMKQHEFTPYMTKIFDQDNAVIGYSVFYASMYGEDEIPDDVVYFGEDPVGDFTHDVFANLKGYLPSTTNMTSHSEPYNTMQYVLDISTL